MQHNVYMVSQTEKTNYVLHILSTPTVTEKSRIIIFTNSTKTAAWLAVELTSMLSNQKHRRMIQALHPRRTNEGREKALRSFQNPSIPAIIITTDLGARGIDFVNVDHVIHFDVPKTVHQYIHRNGRTGRQGVGHGYTHALFIPEDARLARPMLRYFREVQNDTGVDSLPSKFIEYANESFAERVERAVGTVAPGRRSIKDRKRFESLSKPLVGEERIYGDVVVAGNRKDATPHLFNIEHGIRKQLKKDLHLRKAARP
eukprot:PhF_6_TR36317/c0_g1_i2/m.53114/K13982/DDX4, VASA; probable ATP-dependent RNA helicase DDX4